MYKFKILKDINVKNKRVLLRVNFDLPIDENGKISDTFRLKESLPTINYLIKQNCKVILISHLGRPAVKKLSLKPIAKILSKFLKKEVLFASDPKKMKFGDVLLLENIRFDKREEENNPEFAKELAKLGDIYINDAFAVSHRKHASIVSIPKLLPSAAGFLLEKEIKELNKILKNPKRPLIAIIGGAKISTKIKVINKFLKIADKVLVGGALANNIFAFQGFDMGKSVIDKKSFKEVKRINFNPPAGGPKLFLPVDLENRGGKALDIGSKTIKLFCELVKNARTIVWNGPMGLIEQKPFDKGTRELINCIAKSRAHSVAGGGDTIAFINKIHKEKDFNHLSTGGGAMLDYLANETLSGIEALKK